MDLLPLLEKQIRPPVLMLWIIHHHSGRVNIINIMGGGGVWKGHKV